MFTFFFRKMVRTLKNTPLQQKDFLRFYKQIDTIKKPVSSALEWVLNYEKNNVNYISAKLFNSKLKSVSQQDIDNAHIFLGQYSNTLKRLKDELMNDSVLNEPQKKLLLNIIQGNILRLILLHYATYIEAEKWWYPLDQNKKAEYLKKIEKIETIIYGPNISSQTKEKTLIMNNLESLFKEKSHLLNKEQQDLFTSFLEKIPERSSIESTKEIKEEKEWNITEKVSMMDVCHIFQKIVTLYGMPSKIIIIDEKIQEVKEENNILHIPFSYDQKKIGEVVDELNLRKTVRIYLDPRVSGFWIGDAIGSANIDVPAHRESISIKRLCSLIDHEISTHLLRVLNKKNVFNLKTEWHQETEEWIAVLMEKLSIGNIESITDDPLVTNTWVFIAENYDFDTTKKILKSYYLLKEYSEDEAENLAEQRALRTKRYHAFDQPGSNRKDVVYWRWLVDAILYIKNLDKTNQKDLEKLEKDITTFYMSRLGKKDIQNADQLFQWFDINKKNIILPIAIWKILYEKLLGNSIDTTNDIRFLASKQKLDYKQKKLLLEIISFIQEKSIP